MGWKDLPYWLKGGIIGAIIFPILETYLLLNPTSISLLQVTVIILLGIFFVLPAGLLGYNPCFMGGTNCDNALPIFFTILGLFLIILAGFLIGAFIGKIYEKINPRAIKKKI